MLSHIQDTTLKYFYMTISKGYNIKFLTGTQQCLPFRLCMFGGVSTNIDVDPQRPRCDRGADWIVAAPDGVYGWSNEYFEFDLEKSL